MFKLINVLDTQDGMQPAGNPYNVPTSIANLLVRAGRATIATGYSVTGSPDGGYGTYSGWTAVPAIAVVGGKTVTRLTWTGGSGAAPSSSYLGANGLVATAASALDLLANLQPVPEEDPTPTMPVGNGWTPMPSIVTDGARKVMRVTWVGGTGTPPADGYVGSAPGSLVATISQAADVASGGGGGGSATVDQASILGALQASTGLGIKQIATTLGITPGDLLKSYIGPISKTVPTLTWGTLAPTGMRRYGPADECVWLSGIPAVWNNATARWLVEGTSPRLVRVITSGLRVGLGWTCLTAGAERFRIYINGSPTEPVTTAAMTPGVATNPGGAYWLTITLPANPTGEDRMVEILFSGAQGLIGINMEPGTEKAVPRPNRKLGLVTDSYGGGGGTSAVDSMAIQAALQLGCDFHAEIEGGAGFIQTGLNGLTFGAASKIARMALFAPDSLSFLSGVNDDPTTVGYAAGVASVIGSYASACPGVDLSAIGPMPTGAASTVGGTWRPMQTAVIKEAITAAGGEFIDTTGLGESGGIPPEYSASAVYQSGDYVTYLGAVWKATGSGFSNRPPGTINGTGSTWSQVGLIKINGTGDSGTPTGDGNRDVLLLPGGAHYTAEGHKYAGHEIAVALRSEWHVLASNWQATSALGGSGGGGLTPEQDAKLTALPDAAALSASFAAKIGTDKLGAASGVAELDSTGKLKASQLPASALVDVSATGAALSAGVLSFTQDEGGPTITVDLNSFATDAEVTANLAEKASTAQGAKADTALQPGALPVGTTVTAAQVSDAGAAGRTLLQKETLPEIQALVSGGRAIVTLPSGIASLSTALASSAAQIRQAASHKHCIIVIDSDSTSNGLAAGASPIYPFGSNLLNGATIVGEALRAAGVKVNRTRWVGQMGQQTLGNSNGLTDPRVGGTYTETMNSGVICGGWQNIAVGNKRSYVVDEPVDRAQLCFITNSGSTPGTITVDVNGGAVLYSFNQNVTGSARVSAPINLGGLLKPGDVINVNATIGTVFETGIWAWNSHNPGVTIINNGGSGKSAAQGAATGGFNARSMYAALNTAGTPAALAMVSMILNSLADTSLTYQGYLTTLYTQIKAASSATDVLFFDGPQCAVAQANSANWPVRQADGKAVAAANNCAYISTNHMFGASPGTGGGSIYYVTDNVGHMTALGYEEMYRGLARPIVDAVKSI